MVKNMKYMVFVCLILALAGCSIDSFSVNTIKWKLDKDGFIQWCTDDPKNYGYSFLSLYDNNNSDQDIYEIECKKISGNQLGAYGMLFRAVDNDHFYCVFIAADGYYYMGIKNGAGKGEDIDGIEVIEKEDGWAKSDKLNIGYDIINKIRVTRSGDDYTIYFNGEYVNKFTDNRITGDKIGYFVEVGPYPYEVFPYSPVDVRFKQVQ